MSLNFGGINIGGTNSGGGGGGDYLNTNASNLSSTGKKVFDGQWICPENAIVIESNAQAVTTGKTYDLSELLPEDNYIYEIMLRAWAIPGATNANSHIISVRSDLLKNQAYVVQAVNFNGTKGTQTNTVIIPVGTGRELILTAYANNTGTYGMAIIAYRRIGTNN